ncbi:alpha/beta hydrolase [Streptomyces ipomoeae]|uniref:alpha/beta hydrolase n=1 Tax=Streptomyces ipomoeae TaxID=103232 RepID=UPI0006629AA4|nr:Tat pathway signal sequence domain protein [Streptomyces ipomoeae]MDX2699935.1 alpha/beta hydrolase [Streptomyces ipomoeae]MDX2828257.1 alpha/beta hydrolase [Streptomyces ipomoeae]MDX2846226.1 alpha/beta hydrolase [Streptomyces ipomoeae]MDX2880765.1 alpha/beta hydrolase [Streptomyces ipomoeae]TQE22134.1 alpha/beta hydrolase [Streptomyces ipomoeae]
MTYRPSRRTILSGLAGGLAAVAGGGSAWAATGAPGRAAGGTTRGKAYGGGAYGGAVEPYVPIAVGAGGGPAGSDRVHVLKVGPRDAATVLVLVPGMFGAANDFRLLARDLVAAVPGVQVWALDRREENLTDRSGFTGADPVAYYLDGRYRSQDPAASAFVGGWGLGLTLADLRTVVLAARDGGRRRVVLGGHSWGATTALAYAAWDFDGRAGYRDLAGLAVIDGGVRGAFEGNGTPVQDSPEEVRQRLAAIEGGRVFDLTLSGVGLGSRAESTQIWYQLAGWYAHHDPQGRSVLQERLPDAFRTPYPITNAALLGTLVDAGFGWPNDISVHSGRIATESESGGGVRGWVDEGITPIGRVAEAYAGPMPGVWEWYWPARLSVDLDVADVYADTELARSLGLRLWHAAALDTPLYAFGTSYSHGTVLDGARRVVAESRIPYAAYESDEAMNHLDPLFAAPAHNTVTRTLTEFLHRVR